MVACRRHTRAAEMKRVVKWRDPDSNRGHHDFQSCALPAELSRPFGRAMLAGWGRRIRLSPQPARPSRYYLRGRPRRPPDGAADLRPAGAAVLRPAGAADLRPAGAADLRPAVR